MTQTIDYNKISPSWSGAAVQRIHELSKQGVAPASISKETGVPASTVRWLLNRIENNMTSNRKISGKPKEAKAPEPEVDLFNLVEQKEEPARPETRKVVLVSNLMLGGYAPGLPPLTVREESIEMLKGYLNRVSEDVPRDSRLTLAFTGNAIHPDMSGAALSKACDVIVNVVLSFKAKMAVKGVNVEVRIITAAAPKLRGPVSIMPIQEGSLNACDSHLALTLLQRGVPTVKSQALSLQSPNGRVVGVLSGNWLKRTPGRTSPSDIALRDAVSGVRSILRCADAFVFLGCGGEAHMSRDYAVCGDFGASAKMNTYVQGNAIQYAFSFVESGMVVEAHELH